MKVNEEKALILGREKIGTLLLQYATPAIIAQIASSLFNVVDRIFIGQGVGALAISGLALTFPFYELSSGIWSLSWRWSIGLNLNQIRRKRLQNRKTCFRKRNYTKSYLWNSFLQLRVCHF